MSILVSGMIFRLFITSLDMMTPLAKLNISYNPAKFSLNSTVNFVYYYAITDNHTLQTSLSLSLNQQHFLFISVKLIYV